MTAPRGTTSTSIGPSTTPIVDGPAVRIDDVTVRYSSKKRTTVALSEVNLEVAKGEFVALVGPSGCGKSTLLYLVAGLTRATSGTVTLHGQAVTSPRTDIGFVFQKSALAPWRSARRNILLQAEMRGLPKEQYAARADELIEITGLKGFEDALPHELSGGMQQRVSLCRALLHSPPVLLMDEPFGALDALTRETMMAELHRIWIETGTTILFVTHSIPEAVYLAERVVVMTPRPGKIDEILPIDLPRDRGGMGIMSDENFARPAARIRHLLGSGWHG